jgi:hypothetical protein
MLVLLSSVPDCSFVQGIHPYKHDIVFKYAYSMHLYVPLIYEEDYFSFTNSRKFCITLMLFPLLNYMFQLPASFCSFTFSSSESRMLSKTIRSICIPLVDYKTIHLSILLSKSLEIFLTRFLSTEKQYVYRWLSRNILNEIPLTL